MTRSTSDLRYEVVQIWKIPAEKLLVCGLGALPLAFIGQIEQSEFHRLFGAFKGSIEARHQRKDGG